MPLRPLLIQLNNEMLYDLFGVIDAPLLIEGENGALVEKRYLTEYCARTMRSGDEKADELIPKLLEIQSWFRERGRVFFYLVTPSKLATMPDKFLGRFPCPNSPRERAAYVPRLVQRLKQAGIQVLDTASLIHRAQGQYPVDMFPLRGIHWNDLGVALATEAIIAEVNALAGRELVPKMGWKMEIRDHATGMDLDLGGVLNLLAPRTRDRVPHVDYVLERPCDGHPATTLNAATVGSSFIGQPGSALIWGNCLKKLQRYHYLSRLREGFDPSMTKVNLSNADLLPLLDAEVLILEENESFREESNYVARLLRLLKTGSTAAAPTG